MKKLILSVGLMLSSFTFASDINENNMSSTEFGKLKGVKYTLEIDDISRATNKPATLSFDSLGDKGVLVYGYSSCNNYRGSLAFNDNENIKVEKVMSTMKMCNPDAMKAEQFFLNQLSKWNSIEINNNVLILKNNENTLILKAK